MSQNGLLTWAMRVKVGVGFHNKVTNAPGELRQDGHHVQLLFIGHSILKIFISVMNQNRMLANTRVPIEYSALSILEHLSFSVSFECERIGSLTLAQTIS